MTRARGDPMKRVTDFALVEYFVPDGTALPEEITEYLKLYDPPRYVVQNSTGKHGRLYEIPRYMMAEWLEKYGKGETE